MHAVNAPSLPARRCPLMSEMSGSENILCCPCVAMHLIESSHDLLSSGYAYDSVPLGQAMMEHDTSTTEGTNVCLKDLGPQTGNKGGLLPIWTSLGFSTNPKTHWL